MSSGSNSSSGIGLGTVSTAGGQTRLYGSTSQIDTEALIEASVAAKKLPADRLEARITANEAKAAAYADVRSLADKLKAVAGGLRNPPGVLGYRDNQFEKKDVYVSADTTTSPSALLSVQAGNDAATGKFEVVVGQLATARKFTADPVAAPDAKLSQAFGAGAEFSGTLTLALDDGRTAAQVAVDGDMTVYDLAAAVNAQRSASGVGASVLKVASGDYRLVLTAGQTGQEVLVGNGPGDEVTSRLGLWNAGSGSFKHALQAPQPAELSIDGVPITRADNQIDDVLPGLTFDLYHAEPGTTVTVEVAPSVSAIKDQVRSFVDAYNGLRDALDRYGAIGSDGKPTDAAALYGEGFARDLRQMVGELANGAVAGLATGAPTSLASLGITLDSGNRLAINDQQLDRRLLADVDAVRGVFEFGFTASSDDLRVGSRTNALAATSFKVDIVDVDGDGQAESASIGGTALRIDGRRLIGPAGSAYAGLELLWAGKGSTSIDVEATQGIGDKLYNYLDGVNDRFTAVSDDLQDSNQAYQEEVKKINERAERLRDQLVEKYAALETAMTLANSMVQQVRAALGSSGQAN